jgi:Flp pilus assembly protein TadG
MRRRTRGQVLVEFALVSPLLFALLFGTIQFGYAFYTYNSLAKAVSDGARFASMRTYYGICNSTCTSDTAYFTAVKNVVVYGNPIPTGSPSPVVHGLAIGNVTVTVTAPAPQNVPTTVTVAITGYSLSLPLTTITLTNKPAAKFAYVGRYAHPT